MARPPKPWYWTERDVWCVTLKGKRHKLAKGKGSRNEAYRRFLQLGGDESKPVTARLTGKAVCDLYIAHAKANLKAITYESYKSFLGRFGPTVASVDANDVQPKHVSMYLDAPRKVAWCRTTRCTNITAIKRAWAKDEGHITLNQIAGIKRPRPARREFIPDDKQVQLLLSKSPPALREFLTFLYETGCRPGEAMILERRHVDLVNSEVRFRIGEDKTSWKTDKPRVIHLSAAAKSIVETLMLRRATGPLFRNFRGRPWTRKAVGRAVGLVRDQEKEIDDQFVAYTLRHHWATDALAKGVPLATVAEMMGISPKIVAQIYSHLSDKKALMMEALSIVRPPAESKESA